MQRRTTVGNFDPYHKWLGIPQGKWMPNHFELLGLSIDEEEPSVIELAIKRQRDFMKGMRGGKFPELVNQILIQIQDAEITLLEPDSRRLYVREIKGGKGYKKSKRNGLSGSSRRGGTVGESSGITREFAGVMSIILAGFVIMAVVAFMLPWSKPTGSGPERSGAGIEIAGADLIANEGKVPGGAGDEVIDGSGVVEADSVSVAANDVAGSSVPVAKPASQGLSTPDRQPSLHMLAELVAESTASIAISSDGKTVFWERNGVIWSAERDDLSEGSTFRNGQEWIVGRHLTISGDVGVLLIKQPNRDSETLHQFTLTDSKPSQPREISTLVPDSGRVYSPHLSSNGNVLCFAGRFNGSLPQLYFSKRSTSGLWSITQPLLRDSQLTDGWTWPWLSGDGKVLLTTNQGQSVLDDKSRYPHNIFVARRTSVNQPFTRAELIDLPEMKSLWFQAPRYLPETGELFVLVQPRSEVGTPTWKPAVIRGVRLGER